MKLVLIFKRSTYKRRKHLFNTLDLLF